VHKNADKLSALENKATQFKKKGRCQNNSVFAVAEDSKVCCV